MNKDRNPIFYKSAEEMDKPISELLEELRSELSRTRGKIFDIMQSYGYKDQIGYIENSITCIIVAMHSEMIEFKRREEKSNRMISKDQLKGI